MAVGRNARIASIVAVVTGDGAVGTAANGEMNGVAVAGCRGDDKMGWRSATVAGGDDETTGERWSVSCGSRHTKKTATRPTTSPINVTS